MFLIAGVSPKTKIIDSKPRRCPVCGLSQAYCKRTDHYFNLFFIPIIRVKKGEPFIMCERCERTINEFEGEYRPRPSNRNKVCDNCGKGLDINYEYCPYCGKHQHKHLT